MTSTAILPGQSKLFKHGRSCKKKLRSVFYSYLVLLLLIDKHTINRISVIYRYSRSPMWRISYRHITRIKGTYTIVVYFHS